MSRLLSKKTVFSFELSFVTKTHDIRRTGTYIFDEKSYKPDLDQSISNLIDTYGIPTSISVRLFPISDTPKQLIEALTKRG